jgi:hypothetical protein
VRFTELERQLVTITLSTTKLTPHVALDPLAATATGFGDRL